MRIYFIHPYAHHGHLVLIFHKESNEPVKMAGGSYFDLAIA